MKDDFNLDDLKLDDKEQEEFTAKDKFNNILSYIPFLNIRLLFVQNQSIKKENVKFNRQGITLFLLYIALFLIVSILSFKLSFIVTILYFCLVIFFAAKAYNGIYVEIEFIEKIMAQFEQKNSENKQK